MKDLKQFFEYLNGVTFPYVVLRNWDGLPYNVEVGQHSDLDLLVYDLEHFKEVIPEAEPVFDLPRVRHKLPIGDTFIYMDLRYIGDDYYPVDFEQAIIDTREWNKAGFFTPNALHHRIALGYHAVHHKGNIAPEYARHLGNASINDLYQALRQSSVGWVAPLDPTVGRYNAYWKGATAIVTEEGDKIIKQQNNYKRYSLLENEHNILKSISNKHFPKVHDLSDNCLTMEHCGEVLTESNAPEDWKEQLVEILKDLKAASIEHRDIRPGNLMVKDRIIKLIDFGWAKKEGLNEKTELVTNPPSCLGFGYRPSDNFDDAFSMRKVMKELDYKIEEKQCVS